MPIVNSFNYYTEPSNYIIIDHFDYINPNIENQLKVIIDTFINNKIYYINIKIYKTFRSYKKRCISIRLPCPNIYDAIIIKDS